MKILTNKSLYATISGNIFLMVLHISIAEKFLVLNSCPNVWTGHNRRKVLFSKKSIGNNSFKFEDISIMPPLAE